ncbi:MAG: Eco57I restriction-modification methylase domain-containing protein [Bacteroidales bacterium]|nr:Eco57I restriction-modification methylase domain-containing protein [Bacteroidales bacterium]
MLTKEEALKKIESLVERFDEQKAFYKNKDYNETQTRQDFINPFWKALGWDMDNESGYAESYREVIHEDRIKVGGATKAPDYSFRLSGGKRLFFLEAKKPSVEIKDDMQPAYQIRRYGWSAKMPISVITDFEEFAIYDCTNKPKPTDKASVGRIKYITYDNYVKEFDFIWDAFSKERVLKGSFDKYIQSDKNKKGTTSVDHDFLQSLDKWRVELARNIALRNKNINEDELNFVVQHTIDRIVFLRIAEDRSAEQYGDLQTAITGGDYYKNLLHLFKIADQKYNSGLFDFNKDKISTEITIDNKVIKSLISEFYYPICPYEFSVLSVEILGSAYEQFLGKSISLSKGGRATIEEKPEVRKAGGVYYTPQYIVDYIVKNTVGKLAPPSPPEGGEASPNPSEGGGFGRELTPDDVAKIKICDPACGSGSFLIGAYQYLLNWHKDYYTKLRVTSYELQVEGRREKGERGVRCEVLTPLGELTTAEKKRILLNNIYGVDLDSNAVEVTKLSLLLKCMEGETKETIEAQQKLFHDRILPSLDNNIKSGNSLIDLDYYDNELDFGEERKIKPFSWKKAFPEVFTQGGFDCIIGNPPYVLVFKDEIKKYLENTYPAFQRNNDLYVAFISNCMRLLRPNGIFSMITPNSFIRGDYFKSLRQLLNQYQINEIVDFGNRQIFSAANVFTCIVNVTKDKPNDSWVMKSDFDVFESTIKSDSDVYIFKAPLVKRLDEFKKFGDYFLIKDVGYNYWSVGRGKQRGGSIGSRILYKGEKENVKDIPYLKGSNFNRYVINEPTQFLRHNYEKYLNKNDIFRFTPEILEANAKIVYRQTSSKLVGTLEMNKYHNDKTVHIILPRDGYDIELKYVLGLFNSKLLNYYYSKLVSEEGRAFAQVKTINVKQLPYVEADVKQQEQIIKHVDQLLHLNKELQTATLPNQKELIQARIAHSEDKINEIVYELYGLTEEEVKIIDLQK